MYEFEDNDFILAKTADTELPGIFYDDPGTDSEEYEDYLNSLKIKTLRDCLLFSGSNSYLRALRFKTNGKETETHV